MFEKKKKQDVGEDEKLEIIKEEEQKPVTKTGFFGFGSLLKRKETSPMPVESDKETLNTDDPVLPETDHTAENLPSEAASVDTSDAMLPLKELKETSVVSEQFEIKTEGGESISIASSLATPETESPPILEEDGFHIPYAPFSVDKKADDLVFDQNSPEGSVNVLDDTGKQEAPDSSSDIPMSSDEQEARLLAAIENQLTIEKPSKRENSSKAKESKTKKQKNDALVDEIIKTAEAVNALNDDDINKIAPENSLLNPDVETPDFLELQVKSGKEVFLSNEKQANATSESALFTGIEEALQAEGKKEQFDQPVAEPEKEEKREKKVSAIKSRLAKIFRKKSAPSDALSAPSKQGEGDSDIPLLNTDNANDAILTDPAAHLLDPTPVAPQGGSGAVILPASAADEVPERNVAALYKSIGLTSNDIPESARAGQQPEADNPFEVLAAPSEAAANEVGKAEGKNNMLVSTIIEAAKKSQEERSKVLGGDFTDQVNVEAEEAEKKKLRHERLLIIGRFCAGFSLLIPLCSWIVFQALLAGESKFSSILKAENHGAIHAAMLTKKTEKESQLELVTKEISSIQEKTNNIRDNKVLKQIIDSRIDFLEIMLGVNKTTLKSLNLTPELNNAIHMLVFNSFSGQLSPDGAGVTISGTVRDPKRLSMSKLTYLIEAINGDEHLDGIELRSFAKTIDELGGSQSSFNFNFKYSTAPKSSGQLVKNK